MREPTTGALYVVTAIVTGSWSVYLIGCVSIGGPSSGWYVITLGASILMLIGGIHVLLPRLRRVWLLAIALAVSTLPWNLDGWLSALVVTSVAWGGLAAASIIRRPAVMPLLASLILGAWWFPASVYSGARAASAYQLVFALTPSVLVLLSCTAALLEIASSTRSKLGESRSGD